jgi:hypothetical protein
MSAKFKLDRIYSCRLPDFEDGIFLFKVEDRTADTVLLSTPDGTKMRHELFIAPNGAEALRPHGQCPHSPVLLAR